MKILGLLAVVMVVALVVGVVGVTRLAALDGHTTRISDEAMASVVRIDDVRMAYRQMRIDLLSLAVDHSPQKVQAMRAAVAKDDADIDAALAGYKKTDMTGRENTAARTMMIAVLLAGLALAIGLRLTVTRMITGPLAKVKDVAEALATGEMTRSTGVTSYDEVGLTARALGHQQALMTTMIDPACGLHSPHPPRRPRIPQARLGAPARADGILRSTR